MDNLLHLKGEMFFHNKHPSHLYVVTEIVTDCTNGPRDGQQIVVYKRINAPDPDVIAMTFAREAHEFMANFTQKARTATQD